MPPRRTIAAPAALAGVGLFSAAPASLTIAPATPGTGICFLRTGARAIPARVDAVSESPAHTRMPVGLPSRNTSLAAHGWSVATVEHILSALAGSGITDALLEIDGPEVPILDGSAAPFVEAITRAGVDELPGACPAITLARDIRVEDGRGGSITASPAAAPFYSYTLDYRPGAQVFAIASTTLDDYASAVAPARTFCLETEAAAMHKAGLFQHLTPRDMLVLRADGSPVDNELRLPDEAARHKLLDLIGDLALLGAPLIARVEAIKSGHALTRRLAREILAAQVV